MICKRCSRRQELRDCTDEELDYGLCDYCIKELRETGELSKYKTNRERWIEWENLNIDCIDFDENGDKVYSHKITVKYKSYDKNNIKEKAYNSLENLLKLQCDNTGGWWEI